MPTDGPANSVSVPGFQGFRNGKAVEWLGAASKASHVSPRFIPDKEVLVAEVTGPLGKEDFDKLSEKVDPWIETHHSLHGFVVHAKKFPGWENLGSFFRHVDFVGEHHRKVKRVALALDGILPEVMPKIAGYFIDAEIKHFAYGDLDNAIAWASEGKRKKGTHTHAGSELKSA